MWTWLVEVYLVARICRDESVTRCDGAGVSISDDLIHSQDQNDPDRHREVA